MEKKRCYGCMKIKSEQPVCEHCGYDNSSKNASHQLPAGTVLKEQYLIGKVLGQGGFGITYLGWDLYLDIPVAIKEYFPAGTVMRETSISMDVVNCSGDVGVRFRNNKERFMREAKMLARFSQVAEIVQIKNFFLANNTAYIVMEYIEGITLKQYVKDRGGSLHETEILELMEPVILALCKIHKAGLVHRDISPDNIMMLPEKVVKLLDFGAVRDVGETAPDQPLTKSTEAILKQGYAPIEQYQNRGSLGPWTDVYALCATMYYCAKGEVPPDAPERLLDEKSAQLQIPQLSSRVEEVIKHGMALRTQDRISSMEQLHQELFEEGRQEAAPALEEAEKEPKESVTEAAPAMPEKVSIFRHISGDKVRNIVIAAITVVLVLIVLLVTLIPGGEKNTNRDISATPTSAEALTLTPTPTTVPTPEVGATTAPTPVSSVVSGKCNTDISWELDLATGVLTVHGKGAIPDYKKPWLPEENGEMPPWYEYMEHVRKLVISEGITSIGMGAFVNPGALQELELPSTLTSIGAYSFAFAETAFSETGVLEIPEGVIDIQAGAFCWTGMREVILPNSLQMLGHSAFGNCSNLRRVVLKNAETTMEGVPIPGDINPFTFNADNGAAPHPDLVVCGYEYSTAAWLANNYGLKFESLGKEEHKTTNGFCGASVEWEFNTETKTLTIFGEGELWHYATDPENPPLDYYTEEELVYGPPMWQIYADLIEHVVFEPGVTVIHNCLLTDLPNLKTIDCGTLEWAVCSIHNCPQVEEIVLPESMDVIGAEIISRMEGLKKITILGASEVQTTAFPECPALEEIWFSKDAYLGDNLIFMAWYEEEMVTIPENVVFYVYEGSDAERYAKEWNIPYVIRKD